MAVWAGSYLGWLHVMEMPDSATDQPWQRNAMMIAAHAVWSIATGFVVEGLERSRHVDRPEG